MKNSEQVSILKNSISAKFAENTTSQKSSRTFKRTIKNTPIQTKRISHYKNTCAEFLTTYNLSKTVENPLNLLNSWKNLEFTLDTIRAIEDHVHNQETNSHTQNIVMCASPKTGTTNFQYLGLAIQRNQRISDVRPSLRGVGSEVYELVRRYSAIIKSLEGDEHEINQKSQISTFSEKLAVEKLAKELFYSENQFRFIHVRHPFARLYSTWKEKSRVKNAHGKINFDLDPFVELSKKYEDEHTVIPENQHISFLAFCRYLVDNFIFTDPAGKASSRFKNSQPTWYGKTFDQLDDPNPHQIRIHDKSEATIFNGNYKNRHWTPYFVLCQPCFLDYGMHSVPKSVQKLEKILVTLIEQSNSYFRPK